MKLFLATDVQYPGGEAKRLSVSAQEVEEGDTVAARIEIGRDDSGAPVVQVTMLVTRRGGEMTATVTRRADA